MLGRRQQINLQFLQVLDAFLLVLTFWGAHSLRYNGAALGFFDIQIPSFKEFQWLLLVLAPCGPLCLHAQGFYEHPSRKNVGRSLAQLGRAGVVLSLIIAACAYFFRLGVESRAVMPIFAFLATALLLLRESIALMQYRRKVRRGEQRERVILVGTRADILTFRKSLSPDEVMEFEIVDDIEVDSKSVQDLVNALHKHGAERVLFVGAHSELGRLQEYIGACEIEGVEAWLSADFMQTTIARPEFDHFGTRPMLVFRAAPSVSWALFFKHLFDRVIALLLIVALSWLFLLIAAAIKLTSKGPFIFRQARGGKNGRPFIMFKFRTMKSDAEMQRDELQKFNVMSGPVFKLEKDPRVTTVGRFLRKTSLDELPQLWNVFKGDMSLVGPRPIVEKEIVRYGRVFKLYTSVKPGITGLWQVSGRNDIGYDERVQLDRFYVQHWSPWLDIYILARTIITLIRRDGAY